jgi:hypothetical protein
MDPESGQINPEITSVLETPAPAPSGGAGADASGN